jgi:hypothetical protein
MAAQDVLVDRARGALEPGEELLEGAGGAPSLADAFAAAAV